VLDLIFYANEVSPLGDTAHDAQVCLVSFGPCLTFLTRRRADSNRELLRGAVCSRQIHASWVLCSGWIFSSVVRFFFQFPVLFSSAHEGVRWPAVHFLSRTLGLLLRVICSARFRLDLVPVAGARHQFPARSIHRSDDRFSSPVFGARSRTRSSRWLISVCRLRRRLRFSADFLGLDRFCSTDSSLVRSCCCLWFFVFAHLRQVRVCCALLTSLVCAGAASSFLADISAVCSCG
jgi:hypothetical protein